MGAAGDQVSQAVEQRRFEYPTYSMPSSVINMNTIFGMMSSLQKSTRRTCGSSHGD